MTNKNIENEDGAHWISVTDLMAGLMMVFLFLAVAFMVILQRQADQIKEVAEIYIKLRESLYEDLLQEFKQDLPKWQAELNKDLSIRFNDEGGLFELGSSKLNENFIDIIDDFFPRYVKILTKAEYQQDIIEVRIEGHTSSDWTSAAAPDVAYINNMRLSQARTRSTLSHILTLKKLQKNKIWLKEKLTANGLSSSKPIYQTTGNEDKQRSRRVEFRVRTDADSRIRSILEKTTGRHFLSNIEN